MCSFVKIKPIIQKPTIYHSSSKDLHMCQTKYTFAFIILGTTWLASMSICEMISYEHVLKYKPTDPCNHSFFRCPRFTFNSTLF